MNLSKRILPLAIVLAAATTGFSKPAQDGDIVAVASSNGNFKTLVAAVKAAGLVEALQGNGPFTVFAPTDAAFQKLEKHKPGTIAMLLKPANKAKLVSILTYHVVPGKVLAADVMGLKNGTKVKTLQGKSVMIRNKHGVMVDKAKVIKTDVLATNGVIHVIDTVLMPK